MWPWWFEREVLEKLDGIARKVDAIFDNLGLEVSDLNIIVKGKNMKAKGSPIKCPCLSSQGAVMPDVTLTTAPASITLVPIDANKNPVPLTPADNVTGTLASDSTSFVIAAGSDTLHYTATIPANTPLGTVANLAATVTGTIQGAAASLTASVKIIINIPPAPVAVDLEIIIA